MSPRPAPVHARTGGECIHHLDTPTADSRTGATYTCKLFRIDCKAKARACGSPKALRVDDGQGRLI